MMGSSVLTGNSVLAEYPGPRPHPAAVDLLDTHEAAAHDEVTALLLRRAWISRAERALGAASLNRSRPALLLVDLDGLKGWNDGLGHAAGDVVLAEVVGALRRGLRHVDLIGRFGGDEFAVLLADDHSPVQAAEIAERLRYRVEVLHPRVPTAVVSCEAGKTGEPSEAPGVTVSIGAACARPEVPPNLRALLVAADTAVYAAKAAGRNTVRAVELRPDGPSDPMPADGTTRTSRGADGPDASR